ncbi:hypothetical protein BOTBODRAFT_139159 [Botryobasidium botryosum FD-172 SS1]|uniref:Threonine/serine exporter-like N-terminal domain-containing protein n=1 Tax=Botryobasidium botryosum (strain FD-172 SS1) TaxID=930990 RepID=A0A067M0S1_BOTB1|nr:hypothetical protein BOTBODRAFT_139159 [Botryobasidium botryosum FD-172 SS1]
MVRNDTTFTLVDAPEDLDYHDPHVAEANDQRIEKEKAALNLPPQKGTRAKLDEKIETTSVAHREKFVLVFAKALMAFGAPSHRIETQLISASTALKLNGQFLHFPLTVMACFNEPDEGRSRNHTVKSAGGFALGQLSKTHRVYKDVVGGEIGADEGVQRLRKLLKEPPIYGTYTRCVIAALCTGIICPLAFNGAFVDMLAAAASGFAMCWLQLVAVEKSPLYGNIFEISVALIISLVARGLSSRWGQLFCYSAISSAGIILILPGYFILCGALELASKKIINGSVKMVFAIVYSLFLGYALTLGSDLWYIIDSEGRKNREIAAQGFERFEFTHGSFVSDNLTTVEALTGLFTFANQTASNLPNPYHYVPTGCYRDPDWPWYRQQYPWWAQFILVPAFSLATSLWNLQPLFDVHTIVMVLIGCVSYATNTLANKFIVGRNDIVSAIGAFVVGVFGGVYGRKVGSTPFTVMVPGVLLLVPAGIAEVGGLASNYRGAEDDQYSSGVILGFRIVQVAIGITVGLFVSALFVYLCPGSKKNMVRRKQAAIFTF